MRQKGNRIKPAQILVQVQYNMCHCTCGCACCFCTSLCVLAGSCGNVSSTVASSVLSARPTSWKIHKTLGWKNRTKYSKKKNQKKPCLSLAGFFSFSFFAVEKHFIWNILPSPWEHTPREVLAESCWTSRSQLWPSLSRFRTLCRWSGPGWLWGADLSPEAVAADERKTVTSHWELKFNKDQQIGLEEPTTRHKLVETMKPTF